MTVTNTQKSQAEKAIKLVDAILGLIEREPRGGHCLYNDLPCVEWEGDQEDDVIKFQDGSRLILRGGRWAVD